MKVQCPNCFEQIDVMVESRRNFHSRRCPSGVSARVDLRKGLNHCYCKSAGGGIYCCRCGDLLKEKIHDGSSAGA